MGQHRKTKETPLWYFIKKLQETFAHYSVFTEILLLSAIEESFVKLLANKNVPAFTYSIFLFLGGHRRAFLYSQKLFSNKAARQIITFPFYTCILYWSCSWSWNLLNAESLITTGVVVVIIIHPQKYQTKHNSNFEALCHSCRSFIRRSKRNRLPSAWRSHTWWSQ